MTQVPEDEQALKEAIHKKFLDWEQAQKLTGKTFASSLLERRDFHNPNMTEFLERLGGLDEYSTKLHRYCDIIVGDDIPDFQKMGAEQRADWERKNTAASSASQSHAAPRTIPFVPSSRTSQAQGPSSYAALLQDRRNQQNQR